MSDPSDDPSPDPFSDWSAESSADSSPDRFSGPSGELPDEFPSHYEFPSPLRRRRPLRRDTRRAHELASARLRSIDTELEALVARRQACLVELDHHRTLLNRRYTTRHGGRRPVVDEPPLPPAPPHAAPLHGVDLRSVAITILRRHGPQRLRDLHGLVHCYGYVVDSDHPVQRLADAMAYECTRGRAERVARGVYAAVTPHAGPARRRPILDPVALRHALRWVKPETDPEPPLIDPPVAHDPEHWTAGTWPGTEDPGPQDPDPQDPGPQDPGAADPGAEADPPPSHPEPLGSDSSTNRSPASETDARVEGGEGVESPPGRRADDDPDDRGRGSEPP